MLQEFDTEHSPIKTDLDLTPQQALEPKFILDISTLIADFKNDETLPSADFVDGWLTLVSGSAQNYHHAAEVIKILDSLAFHFASYYQRRAQEKKEYEILCLGWSRVAADLEDPDSMCYLLKYSINNKYSSEVITHWTTQTISTWLLLIENDRHRTDKEEIIIKAQILIHDLSNDHPQLALTSALNLLSVLHGIRIDGKYAAGLQTEIDSIVDKISGVLILDGITPAEDRNVRMGCERFKGLAELPIKLAKIGDVPAIQSTLGAEFPWFSELTTQLTKSLLVRQLGDATFYLPPTLILGVPGVGKTTYIKRLCELINIPHRTISFSGKTDNRDLVGTARGWSTGHPSLPISLINQHQVANPLIMIDELDKCGGSSHNGRALDSLLTLFEPATAKHIFDEYLGGNADLSHISWICTANTHDQLPSALLSRLRIVKVNPPLPEHYPRIIKTSIDAFFERNRINPALIPVVNDEDWKWFRRYFTPPRTAKKAVEKWLTYQLLNAYGERDQH